MSASHPRPAACAVEEAFREHRARVLAALVGGLRDFELAEDALQDAFTLALERWPRDGTPQTPAAWLYTVARNRAIDRLRRRRTAEEKLEQLGEPEEPGEADRSRSRAPRRGRRRAPGAAVHVLPSRARARGAGGVDAAGRRRPDRRRDRARVPGARRHDVAAPRAGQAQDPRRRDLVRAAGRRGAARPPRRGARGHLPDLQRGLRRHRRRGSVADRAVRRGASPRQAARDRCCPISPRSSGSSR